MKYKLEHSHTIKDRKSITSDPVQPFQAALRAQKAKQERMEAEQEKQRFGEIVKVSHALEEK